MSNNTKIIEPINCTSTNNAVRLYNNLSDSDKYLITALLNTTLALLQSVQQVQMKKNTA